MEILIGAAGALIAGFLGAWAGAEGTSKSWRRIGVPLVSVAYAAFVLHAWEAIFLMARAGALSIGYGTPSDTDPGSTLGEFWNDWLEDLKKTRIAVRATVGLIEAISIIVIPIITGAWIPYAIASVLIFFNNILWGGIVENEGMITLFGKDLLLEEVYLHGINTLIIFALVVFS